MFVEFPKWIDLPGEVRKIVHSAEEEAEELKAWIVAEAEKAESTIKNAVSGTKKQEGK